MSMLSVDPNASLLQNTIAIVNQVRNQAAKVNPGSMVSLTKIARVEPLVIVSKDCMNLDYLPDVMQTMLNVFTGYYLQAISILGAVDSAKVVKVLDQLNPDRDIETTVFGPGFESIDNSPTLYMDKYQYKLPGVSLEAAAATKPKEITPDISTTTNGQRLMNEMVNSAVGKIVDVTINVSDPATGAAQKVKIPVSIRLTPVMVPNSTITQITTIRSEDDSLLERYHSWRAGRISFIKDLIFCQDMIKEYRKALMEDGNGAYTEILRRVNNAKKTGLLSNTPSANAASTLMIITEDVAKEIEQRLGGKLSNARIRSRMFDNTYAMVICVIDRGYERVTFYHRGIEAFSDFSVREIKNLGKNKGPDIVDILRAYQSNNAPSF